MLCRLKCLPEWREKDRSIIYILGKITWSVYSKGKMFENHMSTYETYIDNKIHREYILGCMGDIKNSADSKTIIQLI